MPLLNYTTKVEVQVTLGHIQALLARAKARRVTIDYEGGMTSPTAIEFTCQTPTGEHAFALPANVEAVQKTLRGQNVQLSYQSHEHAAKVAWRIVKDWLEAQLAIIESGMVTLDEVMLPYALLDDAGTTMYRAFASRQLALPSPQKAGAKP